MQGKSEQNFVKVSLFHFLFLLLFTHFAKISKLAHTCSNLAEIWNMNWGSKGKYQDQIGVNLIDIQEFMNDFMHKTISNSKFCHVYRINRFKKQAENQYKAMPSTIVVPFGG